MRIGRIVSVWATVGWAAVVLAGFVAIFWGIVHRPYIALLGTWYFPRLVLDGVDTLATLVICRRRKKDRMSIGRQRIVQRPDISLGPAVIVGGDDIDGADRQRK